MQLNEDREGREDLLTPLIERQVEPRFVDTVFSEIVMFVKVSARTSGESLAMAAATLLQHYLVTSHLSTEEVVVVGFCGATTSVLTVLIVGFHMAFMHVYALTDKTQASAYSVARIALGINLVFAVVLFELFSLSDVVVSMFFTNPTSKVLAYVYLWASLPGLIAVTFSCVFKSVLVLTKRPELKSAIVIGGVATRSALTLAWAHRQNGCLRIAMAYSIGYTFECVAYIVCNMFFCDWEALRRHSSARSTWASMAEYIRVGTLSMVTMITSSNYMHITMLFVQYYMDETATLLHTLMCNMALLEYYTHTVPIFNTTWTRTIFSTHKEIVLALSALYAAVTSAFAVFASILYGPHVVSVFTGDLAMRSELVGYLPLVMLYCAMEKMLSSLSGALHGVGGQQRVATVNLLGYGVLGPCLHFAMQHWLGLTGVWVAMSATTITMIMACSYLLRCAK